MRIPVLALSVVALLGSPALAGQPASPGQSITVTGTRYQTYRDRLAACLARRCPVNEDVDATMALAEALFLDGEYIEARRAVEASLRRNRDFASAFPEPVSDLYRVDGRLARHLGLDREARTSTARILNALQAGLPREDHRHFTARFEIAEMHMMSGSLDAARRELADLVLAARAAGREDVAVMAELREANYYMMAYPTLRGITRLRLIEWSNLTGTTPADRLRSVGARAILARAYRAEGDTARADEMLGSLARTSANGRRRLLYSPSYALMSQEVRGVGDDLYFVSTTTASSSFTSGMDDAWIDVGFWIGPDGSVSGVEVLRHGADTVWARPLLEAIRGRRYSTAAESTYRMERYTYTSRWQARTGTRLTQRAPGARVEYFDLTNAPAAPPPSPPEPAPAQNPGGGGRPAA